MQLCAVNILTNTKWISFLPARKIMSRLTCSSLETDLEISVQGKISDFIGG
jgi:hypothetical protein